MCRKGAELNTALAEPKQVGSARRGKGLGKVESRRIAVLHGKSHRHDNQKDQWNEPMKSGESTGCSRGPERRLVLSLIHLE
jgi:hypothetical protein